VPVAWWDWRQEYRFLVPQLVDAGYRVVTMDVRGHGESSVSWPDYSVAGIGADALALIRLLAFSAASQLSHRLVSEHQGTLRWYTSVWEGKTVHQ
jgi:pimeloyl-ACP methyl ester carboxylesterase